MTTRSTLKTTTASLFALVLAQAAHAQDFNIPGGDLARALNAYTAQTGQSLVVSGDAVRGVTSKGVRGNLPVDDALSRILSGTGFTIQRESGVIAVVRGERQSSSMLSESSLQFAQAAPPPRTSVETVTVTSSKLGGGDVQSIPIAITALSQEQLTATQTAGGPDLVKQVPNLTFTKTNFTGYSIQIRGIGTQAISVTTDPAVAVAFNDMPFIRNHFFEQEFYDVSQVEVLRGPQGTLYGRNATAGVVNLVSAKPSDQFEAKLSGDIGNYKNRRFEGMVNLPIVDDRLAIRIAGEWTKRNGYTTNGITGNQVDGRNLWSGRLSIGWKPLENVRADFVWEHFSEDDDRMRTAKQLCKTDPGVKNVLGLNVPEVMLGGNGVLQAFKVSTASLSQGCLPSSLYADESFGVPNGFSLPYVVAGWVSGSMAVKNPYADTRQSTNLRLIETQIDPRYKSKNDTIQFNVDVGVAPGLTLTSQSGYNQDFLWSTEDYNRFNTAPDMFQKNTITGTRGLTTVNDDGEFCDPQLGCSSRLVVQDISREHAWQLNQEIRLASKFDGPLNFSVGGNFMHYETEEDYFVFANTLTMFTTYSGLNGSMRQTPWIPGVTDNVDALSGNCTLRTGGFYPEYNVPDQGAGQPTSSCYYIDPNSLDSVNSKGHNYFLSQNPYLLNSYALFGEAYYQVADDIKLTGGVRWTDDQKHFTLIPSELIANGYGYASTGVVDQEWKKFTGRFAASWTPKLDFTDQTLIYASYARGYKAGGANPPGAVLSGYSSNLVSGVPIHPLTFEPEYIHAFELGTKNTLMDGAITFNGNVFYYDYTGYQISEIVDRTSINLNFDASVKGAEIEATYEPMPGLRFRFAGGYEQTRLAKGSQSVDLMDRTAGHDDWMVFKPFITLPSNCILPKEVVRAMLLHYANVGQGNPAVSACNNAYSSMNDPVSTAAFVGGPYDPDTDMILSDGSHYYGFDPTTAPNNGAGFSKNLSGNELPNAPPLTASFSAEYSIPLNDNWAGTLRGDYYWQDYSWARVFNDRPYDRIRGYTNVNLALILTSQDGWQVMGYVKNVLDTTSVTGAFLNSDDSGLTTNVFITDPRLFGVRVTKNW
ncbi:MAG TPA: TonB-dependent receptor [Rhizomicrobium sp.]|nr:TonB-dependent receptor [Rhizomicrobium sp.]